MVTKCLKTMMKCLAVAALVLCLVPAAGLCAPPKAGETLPKLDLAVPGSPQDRTYLGIGETAGFALEDIDAPIIVLEIMGVYCVQCHKQRPHINSLHHRVMTYPGLDKKVRFLGIAAGGAPMEAAYYMKQFKVPYPILPDERFIVHKLLGEPRTPYNMVVTKRGEVLWDHLGVIEDMNAFFSTLKSLVDTAAPSE